MLLFTFGCSPTYKISKDYSKADLYNNFDKSCYAKSIKITLTNDSSFIAPGGANISNDSLILFPSDGNVNTTYLKLDKVKQVSYKNNWLPISCGVAIGVITGGIAGALGAVSARDKNGNFDRSKSTIQGILLGGVTGSVIGLFIGYTYTYQFTY
ncbi:MAG: hypothetical protein P4L45_14775 [Ignavibacteriaceae bacterium]|nr:hypothetical protein [Ignavibacteriaceae bacterium]